MLSIAPTKHAALRIDVYPRHFEFRECDASASVPRNNSGQPGLTIILKLREDGTGPEYQL